MANFRLLHKQLEGLKNFVTYQQDNNSQYTLFIPWCGQTLEWQLLLNDCFPKRPPDIIFDDKFFNPFLPWQKDITVKDLVKSWDTQDLSSLKILIKGLLKAYNNYQIGIVKNLKNQQVEFELDSLEKNSYEVYVEKPGQFSQIRILVKLQELDEKFKQSTSGFQRQQKDLLDLNDYQNYQMGSQSALIVIFGVHQNNRNNRNNQISSIPDIRLKLSELILSQTGQINLPDWAEDQYIVGYIDLINKEIEKGFQKFAQTRDVRQDYIDLLCQNLCFQTEFFDPSSGFSSANFIVHFGEFQFVVTIVMEDRFPAQAPQIIFESLQKHNFQTGDQMKKWNMKWPIQDMVDYTFDFIKDQLAVQAKNMRLGVQE